MNDDGDDLRICVFPYAWLSRESLRHFPIQYYMQWLVGNLLLQGDYGARYDKQVVPLGSRDGRCHYLADLRAPFCRPVRKWDVYSVNTDCNVWPGQ